MKLLKVLLLPVILPYAVYVFARVLRAKGIEAGIEHLRQAAEAFDAKMYILDQQLPQGSHSHKRIGRGLRKAYRAKVKEAYVKS